MALGSGKREDAVANTSTADASLRDYARLGKLELVSVQTIVPYANNARSHSDRGINLIMRSIEANGFITPVLIDSDNNLIAGHGRIEAAKRLALKAVPALRFDHLSPDQVRAYRIIDNRHAEMSGWNREMLAIEYQHLVEIDLGFNIETIGFSMGEIDIMLDGPEAAGADEAEAAGPDLSEPTVTRTGDIWICGPHRVSCGSSVSAEAVATATADEVIDMAIEDAPYNVSITKHVGGLGKTKHREFVQASGNMSDAEFLGFLTDHMKAVAAVVKPGAVVMEFMDYQQLSSRKWVFALR